MEDNSWEQFGKENPYWAVLTSPRFETKNLNEDTLDEFFNTGEEHVTQVLTKLQKLFPFDNVSIIKNALDFGCGTGRILVPFAKRFQNVVGIDISDSMLKEAQKNLDKREIKNVALIQSNDITNTKFPCNFDFVHSFIVLQHVLPEKGYAIIDKLISLLNKGGFGMIHFTYYKEKPIWKNLAYNIKRRNKWALQLSNILQGKVANAPFMQMNSYNLVKVFDIFIAHKVEDINIKLVNDGGFLGVCIFFKK